MNKQFLLILLSIKVCGCQIRYFFSVIMNAPGDAEGSSYPPDTIHLELNASSVITVAYSSPQISLCFIVIDLPIATNTFNLMQLISIHGGDIPNY